MRRDVAAVALGDDVLAEGLHGRAGDDLGADGRLDGHLEHLPRDDFLELDADVAAAVEGAVAVDDDGERVDRLAVDEDVELDQVGRPGSP